jgi:2-oxoglutarate ferredoxin oxidoreductase subunit delta
VRVQVEPLRPLGLVTIIVAAPESGGEKRFWRKPLDFEKYKIPKGKVIVIEERCKGCGFCIEFCPKEMLEESDVRNKKGYKLPKIKEGMEDECIACHHCEDICPEFGIYIEDVEEEEEKKKEDEEDGPEA